MPFPTTSSISPTCARIRWPRGEQGARGRLRAAVSSRAGPSPAGSTRCRRSSARGPPPRRRGARRGARGRRGIVWGIGAHVIKTGVVARADRSDAARLRVGARDERRRHHSRLRDRALGRDVRGRRRGARARAVRHGRGDRPRSQRRHRAGVAASQGSARRSARISPSAPPIADVSLLAAAAPPAAFRSPSTSASAPTSFTCTPPRPAQRSATPACATSATSRRLCASRPRRVPELRIRRRPAGSVPQGRGARPQQGIRSTA